VEKSFSIRCALIRDSPRAAPIAFLMTFFGFLFYRLLSAHMLARKPDGLYSGGSTWGDLAWHLSMLSNFAERGLMAVEGNPIFPGTKLSYPFVPDLLSACLTRFGMSLQASLVVPALLAILASVIALYLLVRSMGANGFGAVITPFLFFFNGSISGCYYLWKQYRSSVGFPFSVTVLRSDYSHIPEHNLYFSNFISDCFLPQRAADFGLCFGTVVVMLLWQYWKRSRPKYLFYSGLLLSCMPLIHFHSFLALGIVAGFLFLIQLFNERPAWRSTLSAWASWALPMLVLALPQVTWILPMHPGHFVRPQLGWMKGSDPLLWFWVKNLSPHLCIFVLSYFAATPKVKTFYLAFVGLFALTNLVVFQPWDFDNLKLILWWFLISCVLAGSMLGELRHRFSRFGLVLSLFLMATMIATGSASVWRELHLSQRMFSLEDLSLAQYVNDQTSTNDIFLTSDKHNNPVPCLAGRRIVMGYRGWLWTHGVDYRSREHDVIEMYEGSTQALELLREYRVNYVLIEKDKIVDFHEFPEFFINHFSVVFRSPNYTLVKVSE
jgi:hypothetical protein